MKQENEDAMIEKIAEVAHETNRAYCAAILKDYSHKPWHETPQIIKDSAIAGVRVRLQSAETPEQMHENWFKYKRQEGWVYGPVKNLEKKTHPCMLPFNELPETEQIKDRLFSSIVQALSVLV